MEELYHAGFDLHKRTIVIDVKDGMGKSIQKGTVQASRQALNDWCLTAPRPFVAIMEATLFTGWVYDELLPHAQDVKVANPMLLHYISKGKKKNDRLDAGKLADLSRVDMVPEVYMLPKEVRLVRDLLRYRHWLIREITRFKNKLSGQLMMYGVEYNKRRLHGKGYFREFVDNLDEDKRLLTMLRLSRGQIEVLQTLERQVRSLIYTHPDVAQRVKLLQSIPGVGEITALTWILEVWDPYRFSSYKQAISYCGLCSAQRESAGHERRGPLSKQRNRRLQWVLVEASKMAVHRLKVPELSAIYEKTASGKNKNAATIAVARHLVKWLMAVDRRGAPFIDKRSDKGVKEENAA